MGLIDNIRNKPQEQKIRLIWIILGVVAVVMIVLWIITARFSKAPGRDTTLFDTIGKGIHDVKNNYGK